MPPVTVRPATPDDGTALAALDAATWGPATTPAPAPPPGTPFFGGRTAPADVLVAERDGAVVGYVKLVQALDLPAHAHVLEVQGLVVDPDARRAGVGRRLVEAVTAEAERRGARKLGLRVLGSNTTARRLYAACGFQVEGVLREEWRLSGGWVDDVLMARLLPPAGAGSPDRVAG